MPDMNPKATEPTKQPGRVQQACSKVGNALASVWLLVMSLALLLAWPVSAFIGCVYAGFWLADAADLGGYVGLAIAFGLGLFLAIYTSGPVLKAVYRAVDALKADL